MYEECSLLRILLCIFSKGLFCRVVGFSCFCQLLFYRPGPPLYTPGLAPRLLFGFNIFSLLPINYFFLNDCEPLE